MRKLLGVIGTIVIVAGGANSAIACTFHHHHDQLDAKNAKELADKIKETGFTIKFNPRKKIVDNIQEIKTVLQLMNPELTDHDLTKITLSSMSEKQDSFTDGITLNIIANIVFSATDKAAKNLRVTMVSTTAEAVGKEIINTNLPLPAGIPSDAFFNEKIKSSGAAEVLKKIIITANPLITKNNLDFEIIKLTKSDGEQPTLPTPDNKGDFTSTIRAADNTQIQKKFSLTVLPSNEAVGNKLQEQFGSPTKPLPIYVFDDEITETTSLRDDNFDDHISGALANSNLFKSPLTYNTIKVEKKDTKITVGVNIQVSLAVTTATWKGATPTVHYYIIYIKVSTTQRSLTLKRMRINLGSKGGEITLPIGTNISLENLQTKKAVDGALYNAGAFDGLVEGKNAASELKYTLADGSTNLVTDADNIIKVTGKSSGTDSYQMHVWLPTTQVSQSWGEFSYVRNANIYTSYLQAPRDQDNTSAQGLMYSQFYGESQSVGNAQVVRNLKQSLIQDINTTVKGAQLANDVFDDIKLAANESLPIWESTRYSPSSLTVPITATLDGFSSANWNDVKLRGGMFSQDVSVFAAIYVLSLNYNYGNLLGLQLPAGTNPNITSDAFRKVLISTMGEVSPFLKTFFEEHPEYLFSVTGAGVGVVNETLKPGKSGLIGLTRPEWEPSIGVSHSIYLRVTIAS